MVCTVVVGCIVDVVRFVVKVNADEVEGTLIEVLCNIGVVRSLENVVDAVVVVVILGVVTEVTVDEVAFVVVSCIAVL